MVERSSEINQNQNIITEDGRKIDKKSIKKSVWPVRRGLRPDLLDSLKLTDQN